MLTSIVINFAIITLPSWKPANIDVRVSVFNKAYERVNDMYKRYFCLEKDTYIQLYILLKLQFLSIYGVYSGMQVPSMY